MFHIVYDRPRKPIEEKVISIDEAVRIIQERGTKNQVLTHINSPMVDEKVNPTDLVERIRGFFGTNLSAVVAKSQLYEGRNGSNEFYLHIERRDGKKVVVKYLD